jgi:hypothetical protein
LPRPSTHTVVRRSGSRRAATPPSSAARPPSAGVTRERQRPPRPVAGCSSRRRTFSHAPAASLRAWWPMGASRSTRTRGGFGAIWSEPSGRVEVSSGGKATRASWSAPQARPQRPDGGSSVAPVMAITGAPCGRGLPELVPAPPSRRRVRHRCEELVFIARTRPRRGRSPRCPRDAVRRRLRRGARRSRLCRASSRCRSWGLA